MENMNVLEIVIQSVLGVVAFVGVSLVSYLAWNGKKYLQKVDDHDKELILMKESMKNSVTSEQVREIIKDANIQMMIQLVKIETSVNHLSTAEAERRGYEQAKKELINNGN